MTRVREIKTTFTAGEVSRDLLGRGDLRAYENGALKLENVFIKPTGGVTRRAGLGYIDTVAGAGRLIPFEFNTQQNYLLVVTHGNIAVYAGGSKETDITAPWTAGQIQNIAWTQSADTLLLVHPDVPPQSLTRGPSGVWSLQQWSFHTNNVRIYQPFFKFAPAVVTLKPSTTAGLGTMLASQSFFKPEHVNTRLRVHNKDVLITAISSDFLATVNILEPIPNTNATTNWAEQVFGPVRGYPATVAFHQDRLVIGGSRDLPNRLWFSKSGDLMNFELGTGLDDEGIEFGILSDQVNAIRGIFSGRHLQVFTSGAEWMVTGDPLTPSAVQIRRQTRTGSLVDRHVPPVNVDGATLYAARNRQEIHEFLYTDLEQAYKSTDLALLSRHVIEDPIDMDYDPKRRLLFVTREDGKFATLTVFRAEAVAAWTMHETFGNVKSVAVVGDEVYMLVEKDSVYTVQQFDDELYLDNALGGSVETPTSIWSGLDHLEGEDVIVVADGVPVGTKTVSDGEITLDDGALEVQVGKPFTHMIRPLPPSEIKHGGAGRKMRLIQATFRLQDTAAMRLDIGRGLSDVDLAVTEDDETPPVFSGDISVRAIGWMHDTTQPLWYIEQDSPLPFTLLSVTTEIKVND